MSIATYKAGVDSSVTNKTAPASITPTHVGTAYKDLADILDALIGGTLPVSQDTLLKITNKIAALEAAVGTGLTDGDSITNTLSELLAVFSTYPEGTNIQTVLDGKVNVDGTKVLSDVNFSSALKTKLDGIATSANNYVHPSGDGNQHIPATGTSNSGKALIAGSTAGSAAWTTLNMAAISDLAAALAAKADLVSGRLPVSQLPLEIPLANLESENLTDKFNPNQFEEYDDAGTTRLQIIEKDLQPDSEFIHLVNDLGADPLRGESILAPFAGGSATNLATGSVRGTWIRVKESTVISNIKIFIRSSGIYTAAGYNGAGIYSYNKTTGIATLQRSSASSTTLYKNPTGLLNIPLTSSYTAAPGIYLFVLRFEGTSITNNPTIHARVSDGSVMANYDDYRLSVNFTATTFPSTIDIKNTTQIGSFYWFGY